MEPRDYGPFPYTPINDRPKLKWPNGARLAVWIIPNIEFFPLTLGIAGSPYTQPRAGAVGARLGAARLRQPRRHLAHHGCAEQARHPRQSDPQQRYLRSPPTDRQSGSRARLGDPRPQRNQFPVAEPDEAGGRAPVDRPHLVENRRAVRPQAARLARRGSRRDLEHPRLPRR